VPENCAVAIEVPERSAIDETSTGRSPEYLGGAVRYVALHVSPPG
jgi:hypothetical protein